MIRLDKENKTAYNGNMIMSNQLPKQIILFFGSPGSGKGTQARMLAEKFGLFYLGCGDMLRDFSKENSDNAKTVRESQKRGELVPTEIVEKVFFQKLEETLSKGISVISDGFPRNIAQAEALDKVLRKIGKISIKVVLINLSKESAFNRILNRKTCARCKATVPFNSKTKDLKRCPDCGGELILRSDDSKKTLQKRWETYEKETKLLTEYYGKQIIRIDGEPDIEDVFQEVVSKIISV